MSAQAPGEPARPFAPVVSGCPPDWMPHAKPRYHYRAAPAAIARMAPATEPLSIHLTHRRAVLMPPDSTAWQEFPPGPAQPHGDTMPIRPAFRPASQSGFRYGYLPTPETPHPEKAQAVAAINLPADSQTDTG